MPGKNFNKPLLGPSDIDQNQVTIMKFVTSITDDHVEMGKIFSFLEKLAKQKCILFDNALKNPPHDFQKLLRKFLEEKKTANKLLSDLETKEEDMMGVFGTSKLAFQECLVAMEQKDLEAKKTPPSVIDILQRDGFLSANEAYYPTDLDAALKGYLGSLGDGAITVIHDCALYVDPGPVLEATLAMLARPIMTAAERNVGGKGSRILFPVNNGTHHFVFADMRFAPDGSVTLALIDSMEKRKTSLGHQKNNEKILNNLEEAVRRFYPHPRITKKEPEYTGKQGDTAVCPFYTVREVVKAVFEVKDAEIKMAGENLLLHDEDIGKFQLAMTRKIARQSPKMTPDEIAGLAVDQFGILYKSYPNPQCPTLKYRDYKARLHYQFDMSMRTYADIFRIGKYLEGLATKDTPNGKLLSAWLLRGAPLTLVNIISNLKSNTDLIPPALDHDLKALIVACQNGISKSICADSITNQFSVDGVQLDAKAEMTPQFMGEHTLKTATVQSLTVKSSSVDPAELVLVLKIQALPPTVNLPDQLREKLRFFGDRLLLERAETKETNLTLVLKNKPPGSKDAETILNNLKQLVYDMDTRSGIFGPEVDRAVEEELRKLAAAKKVAAATAATFAAAATGPAPAAAAAPVAATATMAVSTAPATPPEHKLPVKPGKPPVPPAAATVSVVSASSAAPRGPIITSPAKTSTIVKRSVWHTLPSGDTHFLVVNVGKSNKNLETARKQLYERLKREPDLHSAPPPDVPDAVVPLKAREVCVKHYLAAEVALDPAAGVFLKDRTLKQCGVIEKTVKPAVESQLEFLLPPRIKLEKNTANFNTFLFDFVHRAIQEQIAKQGGLVPGKKHSIRLNGVHSAKVRLTSAELAIVQYCHLMGLGCQYAKGGEMDLKKILRANGMEVDEGREKSVERETAFAKAFDTFIAAQTASKTRGLSLGGGMPHPGFHSI